MKTAIAIRHVAFEDLGTFAGVLANAGYAVRYLDAGIDALSAFDPMAADLLIVLGGPYGVYQEDRYPFLAEERAILKQRIAAGRPTLGICLGGQLMAAAMDAKVMPSGVSEIGFLPLSLTPVGRAGPLRHLADVPVMHWHGDTFQIPRGAAHLAASELCQNQAFAYGPNILALQFHPEVEPIELEHWLDGYAEELAAAGIDPKTLRGQAAQHGAALQKAADKMLAAWLEELKFN